MERYIFNPEKAKEGGGLTDYLGWFRRNDIDPTQAFPAEPLMKDGGNLRLRIHCRDGRYLINMYVARKYFDKVPVKPFKAEDWL